MKVIVKNTSISTVTCIIRNMNIWTERISINFVPSISTYSSFHETISYPRWYISSSSDATNFPMHKEQTNDG